MSGRERREHSVRTLEELYTVAVGVGLAVAIPHMLRDRGFPVDPATLPPFVAFLLTLIPFYHGTMRHLDRAYVEEEATEVRNGALLADFLLKFVEACAFLTIANLLTRPVAVAWGLALLLGFNAVWGLTAHLLFSRKPRAREELRWALINLVAAPCLAVFLIVSRSSVGNGHPGALLAVALIVFAIVRTGLDYKLCWDLYYPTAESHPTDERPRLAAHKVAERPVRPLRLGVVSR